MFVRRVLLLSLIVLSTLVMPIRSFAADVYSVQLYFGLSIPEGGKVTEAQWQSFVSDSISAKFDGFNVVDSLGYWKGKPERSKIVTIILNDEDMQKAEAIAHDYATKYHQDSVMLVRYPVNKWQFVPGD